MIVFRSLRVKDVVPFKETKFEFGTGIHVVYGLNKTTVASTNGNAAGKSRLFSQIPEVLFDAPVTGTAQDRVKTGERWIDMEVNGTPYTFHRKGSKLQILNESGSPVGRTTKETKQWLSQHIPLTEEDCASYLYLDSLRHHPLVRGTTTERKNFLDSFFDLKKILAERKKITAALSDLVPTKAAAQELVKERDKLREELKRYAKISELKARVEKSRAALDRLQAESSKNMEVRRVVDFVTDNQKAVEALDAMLDGAPLTRDLFDTLLQKAQARLDKSREGLKRSRAYEKYLAQTEAYTSALDQLSARARRVMASGKRDTAARHYAAYTAAKSAAAHAVNAAPPRMDKPTKPPAKPQGTEEDKLMLRDLLRTKLEHAHKFGSGTCPTCGQRVDTADPADLKAKLESVEADIKVYGKWAVYERALISWKKNQEQRDKARLERHEQLELMAKYAAGHKVHLELRELPNEPEPYTGSKLSTAMFEAKVEADIERLRSLEMLEGSVDLIIEYQSLQDKTYKDMSKEVTSLADEHATTVAALEVTRSYRLRLKEIEAKLLEMQEDLDSERLLRLLLQAYSDKGMRKMAVQSISHSLMAQVNKYASRIFPENYRFELNWDSAQINILCHRRNGKRIDTSDVRKLSGAETRLFTYVMVLSLLTFVPDNKRSSLLILDEPAVNMSKETSEAFKELLAIMNQVIPTIVVLTPIAEEVYDGAKPYTVIKQNGVSSIVPGHPTTLARA